MKLTVKISLICILTSLLSGLFFGLLEYDMSASELRWGALRKVESSASVIANFAMEDMDFVSAEKLAKAKKRAYLKDLKVELSSTFNKSLSNTSQMKSCEIGNDTFEAVYKISNDKNTFIATSVFHQPLLAQLRENLWKNLLVWSLCGVATGALIAGFIWIYLSSNIAKMRNILLSQNPSTPDSINSSIEIEELIDLKKTADLLRNVNVKRACRQYDGLDVYASGYNLEQTILDNSIKPLKQVMGNYTVRIDFANTKSDGAFYCILENNKILYAKIESSKNKITKIADSILARDLSKKLLSEVDIWSAFREVSKVFNFSYWDIITVSDSFIKREGLVNNDWTHEIFDSPDSILFSTAIMGQANRYYARLNLGSADERFNAILKLVSPEEGGLIILFDKNTDENQN